MPVLSRTDPTDATPSDQWADAELKQAEAVRALNTMHQKLNLSYAELAIMLWNQSGLEVTSATVHGWLSRIAVVPDELISILRDDEDYCIMLLRMYRPERLPDIIRRPAPAFGEDSALSFILAGRLADVVRIHDDLLQFQE